MDIILSGVGGQGILSIAYVLDNSAVKEGYFFKQSEVHGMAQRGGAVQSHLRFSKKEIWSDLIPEGAGDLILSVEPLEALRYLHYLKGNGVVVTSASPFVNIPNYPDLEGVYDKIAKLRNHTFVNSLSLAALAGSGRAQNMVMLGAAAYLFPFKREACLEQVELLFQSKGEKAVSINRDAFQYGERMSALYRKGLEGGISPRNVRVLCCSANPNAVEMESLPVWKEVFDKHPELFADGVEKGKTIPATVDAAKSALQSGKI